MVKHVAGLASTGLRDWLIQRVSAVIIGLYSLFLLAFLWFHPDLQFGDWQGLFQQQWFRMFTLVTVVSLVGHAWIGMWTVATDYLHPVSVRLVFEVAVILALLVYLVWAIEIVWGL